MPGESLTTSPYHVTPADLHSAAAWAAIVLAGCRVPPRGSNQLWAKEYLTLDHFLRGVSNPKADDASNVAITATLCAPLLFELAGGSKNLPEFSVLYALSLGGALGVSQIPKYLMARPRPSVYAQPDPQTVPPDDFRSFWSAHAASAWASMAVAGYAAMLGAGSGDFSVLVFGVTAALATATSLLRVAAGKHFPSDVVMGAVVGLLSGVGVMASHDVSAIPVMPDARQGLAIVVGMSVATLFAKQYLPARMVKAQVQDCPNIAEGRRW